MGLTPLLKQFDVSLASEAEMYEHFREIPEAFVNTSVIAGKCDLEIEIGKTLLPKFILPEGEVSSFEYLVKLVDEKIFNRFTDITPEIKARLETELDVIKRTGAIVD